MVSVAEVSEVVKKVPTGLWIGGRAVPATGGATFAVFNPADGSEIAQVADATPADAVRALDTAVAAQAEWAATPARERAELLRKMFELLTERAEEFAVLMTLEMGKAIGESRNEVRYGAEFFRWFSEEAVRVHGRFQQAPSGTGRIIVAKDPVGPALAITPWNFPLAMGTRKIGPALAAGCTMIVKPASITPLTMLALAQLATEAGVPDGVLSVITSSHSGAVTAPLFDDDRLRKLTFTGSTEVGKKLVVSSAKKLLRTSMELGGNAPFVVFDDADIDAAVAGAMQAKLRNGGEACTAANRFLVQRPVLAEFTEKLVAAMADSVRLGPGLDPTTTLGPLVSAEQRDIVAALVDDAVAAGAKVLIGGEVPDGPGWFYPATVLADVPPNARILHEEVFGPVAPIVAFDTEQEGIAAANNTEFGLVGYFYTRDLDRTMRVSSAMRTGMVGVNRGVISDPAAPFGGVKESGFGREGGVEGIEEYLNTKYVALT
ncbi:NAD-dependent succinate-semialdehyde dehydrogenase [Nocardia camponoti]|uniref:NAD-dependent succinate-semialdehyde dehydrogenase n=1 Tax=Nocardia camponoti TaxID=1616106 RepID=A0A917QFY4_9NOCA|nr:NAD-dependent succinate-semialdehyde dehydrogenase [Nocardia camponoti]GGK49520.1 NAD-dependent succinate-semialdehyde dehydrogenase [Nocardia camponoti]